MAIVKYSKACGKSSPGLVFLAFSIASEVGFTITTGEISAVTPVTPATTPFKHWKFELDMAERTEDMKSSKITSVEQGVEVTFSTASKELREAIESLSAAMSCYVYALIVDGTGKGWVVGFDPKYGSNRALNKMEDSYKSGKAMTEEDGNASTIKVTGTLSCKAYPLTSALVDDIIDQSATYIDFN